MHRITGPVASAGNFPFASGGISKLQNGSADVNYSGVPTSRSGKYAVDAAGPGRVGISIVGNTIPGNPNTANNFAVYLNGGSDPPLALELDAYGVTTGNLYTQSGGPFALTSRDLRDLTSRCAASTARARNRTSSRTPVARFLPTERGICSGRWTSTTLVHWSRTRRLRAHMRRAFRGGLRAF